MGYVTEYIKYVAQKSQIVAHQLIWNMKTNMFMDEDMQQKDRKFPLHIYRLFTFLCNISINLIYCFIEDIFDILEALANSVTSSLSGPPQAFYEREFEFFAKITDISGQIRPYPKGIERKNACLEALSKIKVSINLFFPEMRF